VPRFTVPAFYRSERVGTAEEPSQPAPKPKARAGEAQAAPPRRGDAADGTRQRRREARPEPDDGEVVAEAGADTARPDTPTKQPAESGPKPRAEPATLPLMDVEIGASEPPRRSSRRPRPEATPTGPPAEQLRLF
jgi:hypothetical protein